MSQVDIERCVFWHDGASLSIYTWRCAEGRVKTDLQFYDSEQAAREAAEKANKETEK